MESPHCLLQVNEQYSLCPLVPEMKHCHSMNISVENWGRGDFGLGFFGGFFRQPLADDCALCVAVSVLCYL